MNAVAKMKRDITAKLLELDQEIESKKQDKEKLIQLRNQEILKMIDKVSCIYLDDSLILSALLVAKEISDSKDNLPDELKIIKKYFDTAFSNYFPKRKKTNQTPI